LLISLLLLPTHITYKLSYQSCLDHHVQEVEEAVQLQLDPEELTLWLQDLNLNNLITFQLSSSMLLNLQPNTLLNLNSLECSQT